MRVRSYEEPTLGTETWLGDARRILRLSFTFRQDLYTIIEPRITTYTLINTLWPAELVHANYGT